MAGGITDAVNYAAGTPLASVAGSAGGGISSGLGALAVVNPWIGVASAVISALSAPSADYSKAGAGSLSGAAFFGAENEFTYKKPIIDFTKPLHIGIAAAVVVGTIYAFKKLKVK